MNESMERGLRFRRLHEGPDVLVVPNPWDAGTARLLERVGFRALATTSAGHAFSAGRRDGSADRASVLAHVATVVDATSLPVTADLEDGFGDTPEEVAATVSAVAGAGAVGCSIEDRPHGPDGNELYELGEAVDRVAAAVEAAAASGIAFTLTARCECFLVGRPDLAETIERLRAYQAAGADVLYAPGLSTRAEIEAVATSVERPVNVVAGLGGTSAFSVADYAEMGVRRVSLGSTLPRVALGAFLRAADELHATGTFGFAAAAVPYSRINDMFEVSS